MTNIFIERDDVIEMICHDRYGKEKPEHVFFDKEDLELVKQHQWCTRKTKDENTFYALTNIKKSNGKYSVLGMHRLLLPVDKPLTVDHIDRDGRNNRRSNLRQATPHQQGVNRGMHRDNASGVKGVHWETRDRKFRAQIRVRGETIYLGTFPTLEEATQARLQAEALYWKPAP